jgi:hypothetical protein
LNDFGGTRSSRWTIRSGGFQIPSGRIKRIPPLTPGGMAKDERLTGRLVFRFGLGWLGFPRSASRY